MDATFSMTAIGHVEGGRETPDDDHWGNNRAAIVLAPHMPTEALAGLGSFSHAEIIFVFDRLLGMTPALARRPRDNPNWPITGIFAQPGSNRPNHIGVTRCRIIAINGNRLELDGLDAIHGTSVLDIKPVVAQFLPRGPMRQPGWVDELMADYW
jgi:tRNA (Thr-GGU) A37 N-methylase